MKYLTRKQATAHLRENGITISDSYLAQGARLSTGPQFRYLGKHPVYTEADLDTWIEARRAAGGVLGAFLQREHLRLGPLTRTARRDPARSHPRRKQSTSDISLPP